MKFSRLKIDFMTDEKCFFCDSGRTLKEGILIKNNLTGEFLISSKSCYIKHKKSFSNNDEIIPNLTRGILNTGNINTSIQSKASAGTVKQIELSNIEYLILRQEKLKNLRGISFNRIDDIYKNYKKNYSITPSESNRLQRLIDKTVKDYPQFSPGRLQRLYAIDYAIEKQPNEKSKEFMRSILEQYKSNRTLSIKQINIFRDIIESINSNIAVKRYHIPEIELIEK